LSHYGGDKGIEDLITSAGNPNKILS